MSEDFDVLIAGAGISGIGVAHHLSQRHPQKRFAILEARDDMGGTWDLFRYPGVRSDSDLQTFGYSFRPWREERAIADGPSILRYIKDTAAESGVDRHIRYRHHVLSAAWSSDEERWTVVAAVDGEERTFTARWLFGAGGYFDYASGYTPDFPGLDDFQGRVVHPQFWPEDLDYDGKRVVVIGSGATAITLVPALAERAEHVTMLQRTPTYIVRLPAVDSVAAFLQRVLPPGLAHRIAREKNVRLTQAFYTFARKYPDRTRALIRRDNIKALPTGFDVDTHFTPPYDPWDQRMCLAPDGDFFRTIRRGDASIVTDHIETLTPDGLRLQSGEELQADILVTATGLKLLPMGGVTLSIDGEDVSPADRFVYQATMLSDVPNFAYAFGYTNASWTLRVDLVADHFCRMLTLMDEHGYAVATPEAPPPGGERPLLEEFGPGYVQRAIDLFPQQGSAAPWELPMDYVKDRRAARVGEVGRHIRFSVSRPRRRVTA